MTLSFYKKATRILIVSLVLLTACKKNKTDQIPLVAVNITININNPQYINLTTVSGWDYVIGGSRGIVVYRANQDEFKAYERHCPYNPKESCGRVDVDSSNVKLIDACCNSEFLITDGSVLSGPSVSPLKQYETSFDGNTLRIYN